MRVKGIVRVLLFGVVIVGGCGADQISKGAVSDRLEVGEGVEIVPGLVRLEHTRNENGAFGFLNSISPSVRRPVLTGLQLFGAAFVAVLVFVWRRRSLRSLIPYLLIIAGAVGNVLDRILLGGVIDFIHVHFRGDYSWPIFNVADILITIGVGLILLQQLRTALRPVEEI